MYKKWSLKLFFNVTIKAKVAKNLIFSRTDLEIDECDVEVRSDAPPGIDWIWALPVSGLGSVRKNYRSRKIILQIP